MNDLRKERRPVDWLMVLDHIGVTLVIAVVTLFCLANIWRFFRTEIVLKVRDNVVTRAVGLFDKMDELTKQTEQREAELKMALKVIEDKIKEVSEICLRIEDRLLGNRPTVIRRYPSHTPDPQNHPPDPAT